MTARHLFKLIIISFLFCMNAEASTYRMIMNYQTNKADWVINKLSSDSILITADSDKQILYNSNGQISSDSKFQYDSLTNILTFEGITIKDNTGVTTFDDAITIPEINNIIYVDGNIYAKTDAGIEAAIAALPATGGIIVLPAGTYVFSAELDIGKSNVTIQGVGYATLIQPSGVVAKAIDVESVSGVVLRDFQVDCNDTMGGISFNNVTNSKILNLYVHDIDADATVQHCIAVTGTSYEIEIDGNRCEVPDDDAIAIGGGPNVHDVRVTNNYCENIRLRSGSTTGPSGIEVDDGAFNILIANNIVKNTHTPGIDVHMHDATAGCENIIITGNYIEGGLWGVAVYKISGTETSKHNDITISNNIIKNCAEGGIKTETANSVLIEGNQLYSCDSGIWVEDGDDIVVSNNELNDYAVQPSSLLASDAASGQANTTVADGTKFTSGDQVTISDDTPDTENVIIYSITGNVITFTANLTLNYTTAQNAIVTNRGMRFGIRTETGSDYVKLLNNSIRRSSTSDYLHNTVPTHYSQIIPDDDDLLFSPSGDIDLHSKHDVGDGDDGHHLTGWRKASEFDRNWDLYFDDAGDCWFDQGSGKLMLNNTQGRTLFHHATIAMGGLYFDRDKDQILFFFDDDGGNQLVFGNAASQFDDFDHTLQTNPTLYIHSDTDPDSNNTEWGSFAHTGTGSGDGSFTILSGTGEISMGDDNLTTTGTLGAGAITGTSFIIGGNTLDTNEWAFLDGQDQAVNIGSTPTFTATNITGVPAASVLAGTFGTGAYVFDNTVSGITDLTCSGNAIANSFRADAHEQTITASEQTITQTGQGSIILTISGFRNDWVLGSTNPVFNDGTQLGQVIVVKANSVGTLSSLTIKDDLGNGKVILNGDMVFQFGYLDSMIMLIWDGSSWQEVYRTLGKDNIFSGLNCGWGQSNEFTGDASGFGYANVFSGYAAGWGQTNTFSGSRAPMGLSNTFSGDYSGYGFSNISNAYAVSFGRYSTDQGHATNWVVTDDLFKIGIGTAVGSRADAFRLLKNGESHWETDSKHYYGLANDVSLQFDGSDWIFNSENVTANDEVHFTNFDKYTFDNHVLIDSNAANTVAIETIENTAGDYQIFRTDATPEASVTGSIGDLANDTTNGVYHFKQSGSATNTGWIVVAGIPVFKSYTFAARSAASGEYFQAGFYDYSTTDVTLTIGGATTQTHGSANQPYAAHAFVVASGAGGADLVLTVSGTSILDDGTRTATDSEIIVADTDAATTNQYFETVKKWLGQITYTLTGAAGAFTFNYGTTKYEDFGNRDFVITDFESVGLANANDTGFNIELLKHSATGWTYAVAGFVAGNTPILNMNTIHSTEQDLSNGKQFAFKRAGLSTSVSGAASEGVIIRVTTGANNSVTYMDSHIGVFVK